MIAAATALALLHPPAKAETIYVEGFNDDGDGVRYGTLGRGTFSDSDSFGDAYREQSFVIGDAAPKIVVPARRAGCLWDDDFGPAEWSAAAKAMWDAPVEWAIDGKAGANIIFNDSDLILEPCNVVMVSRIQSQGHTVTVVDAFFEPNPTGIDLLVMSSDAAMVDYDFPVPFVSSNWPIFSDFLYLTSDTLLDASDSRSLEVTDPSHPIAAGRVPFRARRRTGRSADFHCSRHPGRQRSRLRHSLRFPPWWRWNKGANCWAAGFAVGEVAGSSPARL